MNSTIYRLSFGYLSVILRLGMLSDCLFATLGGALDEFKQQHGNSIICAELLQNPSNPSCNDKVANATRIALRSLDSQDGLFDVHAGSCT